MGWRAAASLLIFVSSGPLAWAQSEPLSVEALPTGDRPSAARLANADDVRKRLGLTPAYDDMRGVEAIKVAVLDFGFDGVGSGRAYLPENAVVVEHYDPEFVRRFRLGDPDYRKGFEPTNRHGRIMAQILWGVTGFPRAGPKFYLLNANGPTMLRRAVRYAIEEKVDIVLFCSSFEGGGNGDGRGPINRIVDDALDAGILWINAAGNFGRRVFSGPIRVLPDGYLRLRNGSDVADLRFRNRVDENTVTVTLTWNDYRDEEDAGTDKDLDVFVEDRTGRRVGSGEKTQVSGARAATAEESRNPRERVVLANLPACPDIPSDPDYCYRIRIRAKQGTFSSADQLRLMVTASREAYVTPNGSLREAFEFVDASGECELYPPADNPRVLTVGDSDPASSIGPTVDRRVKPDVILDDSRAFFTDGEVVTGSSNAAAYVAGAVVMLKAAAPGLRASDLLRLAQRGRTVSTSSSRGQLARASLRLPLWQTPNWTQLAETLRAGR